jgi:hypothetical protein
MACAMRLVAGAFQQSEPAVLLSANSLRFGPVIADRNNGDAQVLFTSCGEKDHGKGILVIFVGAVRKPIRSENQPDGAAVFHLDSLLDSGIPSDLRHLLDSEDPSEWDDLFALQISDLRLDDDQPPSSSCALLNVRRK